MDKIDRMAYCGGIIRDENMAILNHNNCADKINEIIDVLKRILLVSENCKVVEFCCDGLEGDFADYYDIIPNIFYRLGQPSESYLILQKHEQSERKMARSQEYLAKCPYCGASIKCKATVDLIIDAIKNIGVSYSEQDLKDVAEILKGK